MEQNDIDLVIQQRVLQESTDEHYNTSSYVMTVIGQYIEQGNVEKVRQMVNMENCEKIVDTCGRACKDPFKNVEYMTVIWNTYMMQTALKAGVKNSECMSLSDYFLNKLSQARKITDIYAVVVESAVQYTEKIRRYLLSTGGNVYIQKTEEYISAHLTQRIRVGDIAEKLGISENYLSRVFHREKGVTLSKYIQKQKIEAAQNLLLTTSKTILEIALYLSFADESYFCKCFQIQTGMTPMEYKIKNTSPV